MKPVFFKNRSDFRKWLEKNHTKETELIVGYYKVGSERHNMTWSDSVDEALCFGWIDGIRRSIDSESYCIRFTPRKPTSIWSTINIKKVEDLTKAGLMKPEGIEAFGKRLASKSAIYSFESEIKKLPDEFEKKLMSDSAAWDFYQRQPPSYKKSILNWIMSAKQEDTRLRRLEKLITESANHRRIY